MQPQPVVAPPGGGRAFHRPAAEPRSEGAVGGLATSVGAVSLTDRGESAGRGAVRGRRDISETVHQPPPRFTDQKRGKNPDPAQGCCFCVPMIRNTGIYDCFSFTGVQGEPLRVLSNYFKMKQLPDKTIYFYHVDLSPDVEYKKLRRVLLGNQRSVIGNTYLFDGGSSLYLPQRLPERVSIFIFLVI